MTEELKQAAQRLDDFLSQFDENEQERILRYALDHVVPKMKSRALAQRPAAQAYAPDKFCFTEADGSCSSKDPRCMHQPAAQATPKADPLNPGWCVGCNPDNCSGCGIGLNEAQATPTTSGWVETSAPPQRLDWSDTQQATPATPEDMKVYDGIAAGYFADTQQATPEPDDDDDDKWRDVALRFDKHRMQALWHLNAMLQDPVKHADIVRQFLKDPTHPAAATPEPVGEPFAWTSMGQIRFTPPTQDHDTYTALSYTRPAPGVPEGWRNVIAGTLKTDPWDSARVADYNSGWNDCQRKTLRGLERLAAAQAKGGE